MNIKIEGSFNLGSKSYRSYILVYNDRLSKLYGNFLMDIYANEKYYSLLHAILSENPELINQIEEYLLKRDLNYNKFIKNCFLIDGNSDKDFPFNTRYFYYDSAVNYVNDTFIDIYKQEEVNKKHLIPVKDFIAKHIATSRTFKDYLIEEGINKAFSK